jgi:hypothetical protein
MKRGRDEKTEQQHKLHAPVADLLQARRIANSKKVKLNLGLDINGSENKTNPK